MGLPGQPWDGVYDDQNQAVRAAVAFRDHARQVVHGQSDGGHHQGEPWRWPPGRRL